LEIPLKQNGIAIDQQYHYPKTKLAFTLPQRTDDILIISATQVNSSGYSYKSVGKTKT
jgi:hypothetical protein